MQRRVIYHDCQCHFIATVRLYYHIVEKIVFMSRLRDYELHVPRDRAGTENSNTMLKKTEGHRKENAVIKPVNMKHDIKGIN